MKDEERASGIECDLSEVVKALEETSEKEAAAEVTVENDKKADNAKAAEMKNRAQESLSGTQKRKRYEERRMWNQGKKVVEVKVTQSHICAKKLILFRSGKKKNCSCKSSELKLRETGRSIKKKHQDMMKVLVEQIKQLQEQMQSFRHMFTFVQQQQSQIIMKVLEKQN